MLSCLLRAEQAPRAPPTKALHFTALPPAISSVACRAKKRIETQPREAFAGNVLLGPDILCARVDAT